MQINLQEDAGGKAGQGDQLGETDFLSVFWQNLKITNLLHVKDISCQHMRKHHAERKPKWQMGEYTDSEIDAGEIPADNHPKAGPELAHYSPPTLSLPCPCYD